jgi:hypothetical protein
VEPPYQEDSLEEVESFADEEVREVLLDALYTTFNANVTTGTTQYPDCDTKDIIISDGTSSYIIAACNVGTSVAGTGETSYGSLFQRGNNFGFSNDATKAAPIPNSTTRPDVADY